MSSISGICFVVLVLSICSPLPRALDLDAASKQLTDPPAALGGRMVLVSRNSRSRLVLAEHIAWSVRELRGTSIPVGHEVSGSHSINFNSMMSSPDLPENFTTMNNEEEEGIPLELASHPDLGIVAMSGTFSHYSYMLLGQSDYLQLGIGPKEHSLRISHLESSLLQRSSDGSLFIIGGKLEEGAPVTLTSGTKDEESVRIYEKNILCQFLVNFDGTISPRSAPHLSIGVLPEISLVKFVGRNSPNRFIFKNAMALKETARRGFSTTTLINGPPGDGISLELTSHPNMAVVPLSEPYTSQFGVMKLAQLGVGPKRESLHVFYDPRNNFIESASTSFFLTPFDQQIGYGNTIFMVRYDLHQGLVGPHFMSSNITFTINKEGSISPTNAPYLALGCDLPGNANQVMTIKEEIATEEQAQSATTTPANFPMHPNQQEMYAFHLLLSFGLFPFQLLFFCLFMALVLFIKLISCKIWFLILGSVFLGWIPTLFIIGVGRVIKQLWVGLTTRLTKVKNTSDPKQAQ